MNTPSLRQRLAAGELLFGLNHTYPAPGILEIMVPGWDIIWIDGQHGQFGYSELLAAVRTCDLMGVASMVRVPGHEPGILGPVADMAPAAILVPMVNSAAEAQAIVRALRFPPLGERSYGGRRIADLYGGSYPTSTDLVIVLQIETPEGLNECEAIAAVPGVDALFLGPDDMKLRFGLPLETPLYGNERLKDAAVRTAAVAKAAGKYAALPAVTKDNIAQSRALGYQMFFGGSDVGFIRAVAPATLRGLREAVS